ncbi:MAG: hypothetical protein HY369_00955 [Candidatus Aenigmarchaeota archaeon]|nr:hypothetical protein [Candidatus Aenigmarchaeota archaeon]
MIDHVPFSPVWKESLATGASLFCISFVIRSVQVAQLTVGFALFFIFLGVVLQSTERSFTSLWLGIKLFQTLSMVVLGIHILVTLTDLFFWAALILACGGVFQFITLSLWFRGSLEIED